MMKFLEGCDFLMAKGRGDLAQACLNFYEHTRYMNDEREMKWVEPFFDEQLAKYLETDDPIGQEEILLSPDFAPLKAMARAIQALDMPLILADHDIIVED